MKINMDVKPIIRPENTHESNKRIKENLEQSLDQQEVTTSKVRGFIGRFLDILA